MDLYGPYRQRPLFRIIRRKKINRVSLFLDLLTVSGCWDMVLGSADTSYIKSLNITCPNNYCQSIGTSIMTLEIKFFLLRTILKKRTADSNQILPRKTND